MSCAGCDDCPAGHWHLHVTVERRDGMPGYISKTGFEMDMDRLGYRPVSVVNVMRDDSRSYREHIPTLHFEGAENKAAAQLFNMAITLARLGYWPKRLKIEGDPLMVDAGRVLYHEIHVPLTGNQVARARECGAAISTTEKRTIGTMRWKKGQVFDHRALIDLRMMVPEGQTRAEACVLDTAPELDEAWLADAARAM